MTIKQQGGIFGRNPSYNEVDANELNVDNIKIDGNSITSTDTNGDIGLNPNGTGSLLIGNNGQSSYVAAKIRKKFNGSVSVQFDGGGDTAYADFTMDGSENLALRLDPSNTLNDQTFSVSHNGSNIAQFIGSSGDLKVNTGNLVIGTSGQGIDFSATSGTGTSELFDDYEEGTFTPSMEASSGGAPSSYSVRAGSYTKIGDTVYVMINLAVNAGTLSGDIKVTGLPFSPSQGSSIYTAAYRRWNTTFVSYGLIDSGTSAVRIIKSTNNAISETAVTNSDMLSTDNRNSLIISGCYRTT